MAKASGRTRNGSPSSNPNLKGVGNTKKISSHENQMSYADAVDHIMNLTGVDEGDADNMYWAIQDFSGVLSDEIRAASRGENNDRNDLLSLERLERFIELSPKWNGGTTWRGLDLSDEIIDSFKVGDIVDNMGPASWSTDRSMAYGFTNYRGQFYFRCDSPQNGTSIKFASTCPSEDEVTCSERCQYRITKIEKDEFQGSAATIAYVEPIANKKK